MATLRSAIITLVATLTPLAASLAYAQDSDAGRQQRMDSAYQDYKSGRGSSDANMNATPHHTTHANPSTEAAVKRDMHKTGQAIKHGARKTGDAIEHGVEKTKEEAHKVHQKMKGASEPS